MEAYKYQKIDYMNLFSLKGKVCVVSGVANRYGIGAAYACALASAGADLVLVDKNEGFLEENAEHARAYGVRVYTKLCDISDHASVEELLAFTLEKFGKVDVLVNNAARFHGDPFEDIKPEDWKSVMDINVTGNFNMAQVFGREMIRQGIKGSIIFTSSKSGIVPDYPNKQAAYNCSKAAIIMMAKSLAAEWSAYGIRANCIAPGNMLTDNVKERIESNDPMIETWSKLNPMNRFGATSELCGALLFFASDASTYTTGETIRCDGGYCII